MSSGVERAEALLRWRAGGQAAQRSEGQGCTEGWGGPGKDGRSLRRLPTLLTRSAQQECWPQSQFPLQGSLVTRWLNTVRGNDREPRDKLKDTRRRQSESPQNHCVMGRGGGNGEWVISKRPHNRDTWSSSRHNAYAKRVWASDGVQELTAASLRGEGAIVKTMVRKRWL